MDLTAGTRATAVSAAVVMAAGMAVVLYGVAKNDLARSLGGACLTMTAVTLIALVSIRKWTTNTDAARSRLSDATREADNERTRYIAAQAALEVERQRVQRDAASDREQMAVRLASEQAAMQEQFEDDRATLVCETMEQTVLMYRAGAFDPPSQHDRGRVIGFPDRLVQQAAAAERARDHGATR